VFIPVVKQKNKHPKVDLIAIFIQIWNKYKNIFLDHEAAKSKGLGRPPANAKKMFRAIMYILWSGGSWRSLPKGLGAKSTVHQYFLEWTRAGLFEKLWGTIALDAAAEGSIDSNLQMIDGTHILTVYMPTNISGFSYKYKNKRGMTISILIDAQGIPISIELSSANTHDSQLLEGTLSQSVIEEVESSGKTILGDSGYIGKNQENVAEDFGFEPNFRPRQDQKKNYPKKKMKINSKNRWMVERTISWIKNMRRIRSCYEKSLEAFRGFCQLSCAYVVFRRCFL
jgi:putative transposase